MDVSDRRAHGSGICEPLLEDVESLAAEVVKSWALELVISDKATGSERGRIRPESTRLAGLAWPSEVMVSLVADLATADGVTSPEDVRGRGRMRPEHMWIEALTGWPSDVIASIKYSLG